MQIEVLADAQEVARQAAAYIAGEARLAIRERGRFSLAVSGGHTPRRMLQMLAGQEIPWDRVFVVQVDERLAPPEHPDRNFTQLQETLFRQTRLPAGQIYAMPVGAADPAEAAARYAETLREIAGSPPRLDLVHLGLGTDGHTASLLPEDTVLDITDRDTALTGVYQGRRRLTLTYPIINRARRIVWLVTGAEKAEVTARLYIGDQSMPAGRVCRDRALMFVDQDAAGLIKL